MRLEVASGEVGPGAVAQMAPGGQVEAQHAISRGEQGEEHSLVRLHAGMRLDVRIGGAEQRLGPIDRRLLDHVDELARRRRNRLPG